ncbi:hypothetical protein HGB13_04300 [bacterium]|nr:hypothetical protein [bacterium]
MTSSRVSKDAKSIKIIKAGGDVLSDHFSRFCDILASTNMPIIVLASPFDDLLVKAKQLCNGEEISKILGEMEEMFGVSKESSKKVIGLWESVHINLRSEQGDLRDAKIISAISKLSALTLCEKLKDKSISGVKYVSSEYLVQTDSNYLDGEIADVATMERLRALIETLSPGDIVVVPAYIGINYAGEPTYLGDNSSELVASRLAYLAKDTFSDKRVWLNILSPAWYNLHPKWAERYAQGHLKPVPYLTVEEVLSTADFMLSAIVEATVRGVITEIIDISSKNVTRIVKRRGNVNEMPIVAIAGYECEYVEIKRSVYIPPSLEFNVDIGINQLSSSEIVFRASYPTSIVRCLMHKDALNVDVRADIAELSHYLTNVFRTQINTCQCTMIKIIGEGLSDHKDALRIALKKNLNRAGFSIMRYLDDDYYSVTIILKGNGMQGKSGSLAIISKTALNLTNSRN